MWEHLNRQGIRVAKCTVERLMRANGWQGVTRARTVRTTIPDPAHHRAPDLVKRNFKADRPIRLAISRTPHPRARKIAISSRSANDKYRPGSGARLTGQIPPLSRNHRVPTAADTPASMPASSLGIPLAIATQNRCRCSRLATGGRPGERIAGRPA
jgi:transposase InsO family protein